MAIQDKTLSGAEHDWFAVQSGLASSAPLSEHKAKVFSDLGYGGANKPLSQMEAEWLSGLPGVTSRREADKWREAVSALGITPALTTAQNKFLFYTSSDSQMSIVFSDNFNRADNSDIGATWTELTNDVQIKDNHLSNVTGTSGQTIIAHTTDTISVADYTVEADLRTANANMVPAVLARLVDSTHYYFARIEGGGNVSLFLQNGGATQLATTEQGTTVNTTYRLKLSVRGSTLKVYLNNALVITTTDGTLTEAGKAGIRTFVGSELDPDTIQWDNFQVKKFNT